MKKLLSLVFSLVVLMSSAIAQQTYNKVTTAPEDWSGTYLIVCETSNVAFNGALENLDAVNNGSAVTIANGAISTTDLMYFTIESFGNGYSVKSLSGKYIGTTSDANGLTASATPVENTLSMNSDGSVNIISEGGAYLRYNASSGQTRFRYYKSGTYTNQKAITLYVDPTSISSDPALSVSFPAEGALLYSADVVLELNVRNFDLGTQGKIKYTLDSNDAEYVTSTSIELDGLADGEHSVVFELVDMENASLESPVTLTLNFETDDDFSTLVSVADIQHVEGESDVNNFNGQRVGTKGIVTAKTSNGFYIQDSQDLWSGLYVYSPANLSLIEIGDRVLLQGTMSEYNGLTEMADLTVCSVESHNNPLYEPLDVTIAQVAEAYEGMLVRLTGTYTGTNITTYNNSYWKIENAEANMYVGGDCYSYTPLQDSEYEITGIISYSSNIDNNNIGWLIHPRSATDVIEVAEGVVLRVSEPAEGSTILADTVTVAYRVLNFAIGTEGQLKYTLNGGEAQYTTAESFVVRNLVNGTNTLVFEVVNMENASLDPSVTLTVTFTARTSGHLTISDVQYTTDAGGDSPYVGQTVTLSGVVSGLKYSGSTVKGFYMQDAEDAWSGIYVFTSSNTPARNDSVTITGAVSEYYGLTELSVNSINNHGAATAVNGTPVNISQIGEAYESVLVTVTGVCTDSVNNKKWTISDGSSVVIYTNDFTFSATEGTTYTVTGIVEMDTYNNANVWEIKPRSASDIVAGAATPFLAITAPADGSTIFQAVTAATVSVFNFTIGQDGSIAYSLDDAAETTTTETSFVLSGLTAGSHTLVAKLIDNTSAEIARTQSTFIVNLDGPTFTPIHDIQYTTNANGDSPLNNQTVWVKGVVTSNFTQYPYKPLNGYSIQDANEAWSGIWVLDSQNNPNVGDSVKFRATVSEYYGLTELKNVTDFEVFDFGVATPINVTIKDANSEAYEGCFVKVECGRSVGNSMSYGNWICVNEAGDSVSYSHNLQSDAFSCVKDKNYSAAGIVEYSYGAYYVNYRYVSDITVDCSLAVEEELVDVMQIYPNPAHSQINVVLFSKAETIEMINVLGEIVRTVKPTSEVSEINISDLRSGTYFIRVIVNGKPTVSKVIVE